MSALRHRGWALGWHSWGWVLGLGIQRGGGLRFVTGVGSGAECWKCVAGNWGGVLGLGDGVDLSYGTGAGGLSFFSGTDGHWGGSELRRWAGL